ncbi:helix-turn-helix domain-containing protein [Nocardia sp. NPDC060256]|uniref:helix-turn-helix domain-containing protein n=1 Tax=unclassified Nocardia TaxID=2637762 RepID=UPI00364D4F5D
MSTEADWGRLSDRPAVQLSQPNIWNIPGLSSPAFLECSTVAAAYEFHNRPSSATFGEATMTTGSTLPRRLLARELRNARAAARMSSEAARNQIGVSKQTFWRMENGIPTRLNPLFVKRLCEIYGIPADLTQTLLTLVEETKDKGWWHAFDEAVPKSFELFLGLEDAAHRAISYQTTFLPGMLQTNEYRRALLWIEKPNRPESNVETAINIVALRRARLFSDDNPMTLEVFIDESVLRRSTGDAGVMAGQLTHLAETAQRPNVSVRVVPTSAGTYQALTFGTFVLLEFPPHPVAHLTEPPVVYVQGFTDDLYLENPGEVAMYRSAHRDLERLALSAADSEAVIVAIAKEFGA